MTNGDLEERISETATSLTSDAQGEFRNVSIRGLHLPDNLRTPTEVESSEIVAINTTINQALFAENLYLRRQLMQQNEAFNALLQQNEVFASDNRSLAAQNYKLSRDNLEMSQLLSYTRHENMELNRRIEELLKNNEALSSEILVQTSKRARK